MDSFYDRSSTKNQIFGMPNSKKRDGFHFAKHSLFTKLKPYFQNQTLHPDITRVLAFWPQISLCAPENKSTWKKPLLKNALIARMPGT